MDPKLMAQAEILAKQPYITIIRLSETTNGKRIYEAYSPELSGCRGQGKTPDKAAGDLFDARVDYIYSLLEDGLPVPAPQYLMGSQEPEVNPFLERIIDSYDALTLRPEEVLISEGI